MHSVGEMKITNDKCTIDLKGGVASIDAADEIKLTCGGATISLKKDGTIEITGSTKVTANGGGAGVELVAAGATESGTKVSISGTSTAEMTGAIVENQLTAARTATNRDDHGSNRDPPAAASRRGGLVRPRRGGEAAPRDRGRDAAGRGGEAP